MAPRDVLIMRWPGVFSIKGLCWSFYRAFSHIFQVKCSLYFYVCFTIASPFSMINFLFKNNLLLFPLSCHGFTTTSFLSPCPLQKLTSEGPPRPLPPSLQILFSDTPSKIFRSSPQQGATQLTKTKPWMIKAITEPRSTVAIYIIWPQQSLDWIAALH